MIVVTAHVAAVIDHEEAETVHVFPLDTRATDFGKRSKPFLLLESLHAIECTHIIKTSGAKIFSE